MSSTKPQDLLQTPTVRQLPRKLAQHDVFAAIKHNGGPNGVNFEDCDLSGIDLHYKSVRKLIDEARQCLPAWYSSTTHGVNLRGARLQNANLTEATLVQGDLSEASLYHANLQAADLHDSKLTGSYLVDASAPRANFAYCDMQGCYLIRATLTNANFTNARLQGADLTSAKLNEAILCNAKFVGVDLTDADLRGANLFGLWLVDTFLTRQQIGESVIQESKTYKHYVQGPGAEPWPGRYAQAASIYRTLKSNFLSIGAFDDASWAYVKERKMRKMTHWLTQVRESYPIEYSRLPKSGASGKWCQLRFYGRHLLAWALDWVFELTSVYGENPLLTLWWALAFVVGFALLFGWRGGIDGAQTWPDYFVYSLGTFVTLSFNEAVSPIARILSSIEALLGICILALLMFALGNRINRS